VAKNNTFISAGRHRTSSTAIDHPDSFIPGQAGFSNVTFFLS
jgi:hypothetical protein